MFFAEIVNELARNNDGDSILNPTFFGKIIEDEENPDTIAVSGYHEQSGLEWSIRFSKIDSADNSQLSTNLHVDWLREYKNKDARVRFRRVGDVAILVFTIFQPETRKILTKKTFEMDKRLISP